MKKITVLESIRGAAAFYVMLTHILPAHLPISENGLGQILKFGQEAVMLFFLLSGFVIYLSFQKHSNQTFGDYFRRRATRIYPIFLFSLVLTYASACLYFRSWLPVHTGQLLGNLFMLQDFASVKPGVWFDTYYGNAALWSLSYEWWFYMLFYPIVRFTPPNRQKWLVFALSLTGFASFLVVPNSISLFLNYFIIWWTGVEIAKVYSNGQMPSFLSLKAPLTLLLLSALLHLFNVVWRVKHDGIHPSFGTHPVLELRHFVYTLLVISIALILSPDMWKRLSRNMKVFSFIAPISYALYVLHIPIAVNANYLSFLHTPALEIAIYLIIALAISYYAEHPYQKYANQIVRKLTTPSS